MFTPNERFITDLIDSFKSLLEKNKYAIKNGRSSILDYYEQKIYYQVGYFVINRVMSMLEKSMTTKEALEYIVKNPPTNIKDLLGLGKDLPILMSDPDES